MKKNNHEEGTLEYEAFNEGVQAERDRLLSVINKYHRTFCSGDLSEHEDCTKTMQIRYLYDFATETKTLK
tara:strand:+ start:688 stop:897 length:210 start_codon:yes stop_codon:yes gene_type:complete